MRLEVVQIRLNLEVDSDKKLNKLLQAIEKGSRCRVIKQTLLQALDADALDKRKPRQKPDADKPELPSVPNAAPEQS